MPRSVGPHGQASKVITNPSFAATAAAEAYAELNGGAQYQAPAAVEPAKNNRLEGKYYIKLSK